MNPTRWRLVSDLFADALDLSGADRERMLDGESEDIRREVGRLLSEHQCRGLLDQEIIPKQEEARWTGEILNNRYRVERFLARGGAGAVYLARDQLLAGRAVVIKFLEHRDAWLKKKFREEMEALSRIDHHSVVGILDSGETPEGLPFLVIEYIDGVTLRSEIQKGPMPAAHVAILIRQIGVAVSAAHEKGILHRDLKPENIMLQGVGSTNEIVRLIDFGIARVDRPGQDQLTQTTRFAGTTMYMSPEQLAGRPQPASDTYAIGVIAWEMLAGRRPFIAASPVELYEQQRAGVKAGYRTLRGVPSAAVPMILKQLSFRPENRSATAVEAGEQIADALEGKLREGFSRRRVVAAIASGAALTTAAGYTWSRSRPLDPAERVIEVVMGTELLEHGFQKSLDVDYHVLQNADATALDSIRVWSADQGEFFHPLSASQARRAQLRGWTITVEAAVEDGRLYWAIDNPRSQNRFLGCLERNPDNTDTAACILTVAPAQLGIDRVLPGPAGARHRVVMKWNPSTEGELWVDGAKLISGYRGSEGFRYARGLMFGAGRYRSQAAAGQFWRVRLDIA